MDFASLNEEIEFANQSGYTLNITEKTSLGLAVARLNEHEKFDQVLFWGRINGIEKDYYIIKTMRFRDQPNFPET